MIVLQMLRKMYPLPDSGNPGCCRLCGSVKDVTCRKHFLKKVNEELHTTAGAVYRRSLTHFYLRVN